MTFKGKITSIAHRLIKACLDEGNVVIDATVGNGNDTIFMATEVGESGKVIGFDVQEVAINKTKKRLEETKLLSRVELIKDSHSNIYKYVNEKIDGAIFNLGYLPRSNHSIITRSHTTIEAIKQVMELLKEDGRIIITSYYGHEGGREEKDTVEDFLKDVDSTNYNITKIDLLNRPNNPPIIFSIEKNSNKKK